MGAIGNVIGASLKRPFIIVFFSIFALVYSLIGYMFPILNIINIAVSFFTGDLIQSIVSLIQWILKLALTLNGILVILISVIIFSFFIGIILSGYFAIINNTLERKPKYKGEFMDGLKRYFMKVWFATAVCMAIGIAFLLVLMVAWVPALILTKAAMAGKGGYVISAVLVDFITVGVTFFGLMFIRIYLVFWYPSIFNSEKGPFLKGKFLADNFFWKLVIRFLLMDLIFIIFQCFSVNAGTSIIFLPVKWIFNSLFFGFNIIYMFSLFKVYNIKIERKLKKIAE